MRIAIVGAGVSGLVCAHRLGPRHDVVLFEAAPECGGHVHTVDWRGIAVDTGFIVFNRKTYPNFCRLLEELRVAAAPSNMSFSVRAGEREYSSDAPFARRRDLLRPGHWRMLAEIVRWNRLAATADDRPLGEWLAAHGFGRAFSDDHLLPLVGAVWSAEPSQAAQIPARFVTRFFAHHDFLRLFGREPWLTIRGGARTYVRAILARLRGEVRTSTPVKRIARVADRIEVDCGDGGERFDRAIVACHADQALALLAEPTPVERELLGAFPYRRNPAVLHTDGGVMPRRRRAWAAWNHDARGAVTYWMNRLQPLDTTTDLFVTLNRMNDIDPAKVIARMDFAHPVFTAAGIAAQARRVELAVGPIAFCGAYWRNGFHEDGVASALDVSA